MAYLTMKHHISIECYRDLAAHFPQLPRKHKVIEAKNNILVPTITRTPGSNSGAQFDLMELLLEKAEIEISKDADYFNENMEIHVKISMDGVQYTRKSSFCLLTLSILTRDYTLSPANIHTIAVMKASESYHNLAQTFKQVSEDINKLVETPTIHVDHQDYNVILYFCCDYKMVLEVLGLNAANAIYACAWCNVPLSERCDMTKSVNDYKTRTIEALLETDREVLKTPDSKEMRKGRLEDPLIHINLDHWIPDELHLLLRVTDIMTRNLILPAAKEDRKDGHRSKNINDGKTVTKLIEQIQSCGVPFKVRNTSKKVFGFSSLVGVEMFKLKLLKKLPDKLTGCQPEGVLETVNWLAQKFCARNYLVSEFHQTLTFIEGEGGARVVALPLN